MHKRPIICSDIGGMAEKVENDVTGLHFKVRNVSSLTKVMKKAILDENLWQRLVTNINPRLSIETSAIEHIDLYKNA
jgi:glycosyltransferase involved in cell wall biosynthesis